MPKSENNKKQVLLVVRHGKRGYIVEVAGSGEPYPCLTAEDVGEAVIEILDDPDQVSMEFGDTATPAATATAAPTPQAPGDPSDGVVADDGGEDFADPPPSARPSEAPPEGWTAGDELIMGVLGGLADRMRKASAWRTK